MPGTGGHDCLDESRSEWIARDNFADFGAQLLGRRDLVFSGAAGYVEDLAPVAQAGNLRIQARPDDEVRTGSQIERRSGRVNDRADAQDYRRGQPWRSV
jgi:hypothetical protein